MASFFLAIRWRIHRRNAGFPPSKCWLSTEGKTLAVCRRTIQAFCHPATRFSPSKRQLSAIQMLAFRRPNTSFLLFKRQLLVIHHPSASFPPSKCQLSAIQTPAFCRSNVSFLSSKNRAVILFPNVGGHGQKWGDRAIQDSKSPIDHTLKRRKSGGWGWGWDMSPLSHPGITALVQKPGHCHPKPAP